MQRSVARFGLDRILLLRFASIGKLVIYSPGTFPNALLVS